MIRWVFFAQELLRPFFAAAGTVHEMPDEDYQDLKKQAPEGAIFDVTPTQAMPLIWQSGIPKKESVCELVACGACMAQDIKGNWFCAKPMTKCLTCNDTRSVISARVYIPHIFQEAFAKNIREVTKAYESRTNIRKR